MDNLSKKQKIFLYIIIAIAVVVVIIYIFTKDNTIYSSYDNLCLQDNNLENSVIEQNIQENLIYVYIVGEVEKPDVIGLNEGARIVDAIKIAGGLTASAEIKNLNLAYKLKDGDKIYIPSLDEVIKSEEDNKSICYISNGLQSNNIIQNDDVSVNKEKSITYQENGLVNINTAPQTELETLTGIGPSTAKSIIEYRKENGKFSNIEDIMNVSGIGEAKYNLIKDSICVK